MGSASILDRTIRAIILAIGIASGVVTILQYKRPIIGVLIIVAIVVVVLLWSFRGRFRYLASLSRLVGQEAVLQAISEVVKDSKIIVFVGNLTNDIWEIFKPKIQDNKGFGLKVWNTDSQFYVRGKNKKIVGEIVKLDATSAKFSHRYYFYRQNVHLVIGKKSRQESQVMFFVDPDGRQNGILVRRGLRFSDGALIDKASPTISMARQATSIHDIARKTLEFWAPLTKG